MVALPPAPKDAIPWTCRYCGAGCNYEAMTQCEKRWDVGAPCGYEDDKPLSVNGMFEFYTLPPIRKESVIAGVLLAVGIVAFLVNTVLRFMEAVK